jgi:hypothetical protein
VGAFPSRSYTLNRLGDHLPDFVASWGRIQGRALRTELARLELAMTQAFDEDETPPLSPEAFAEVHDGAWAAARLRPIAALRLVPLATNALAVFEALRAGGLARDASKTRSSAVVYRQDFGVRRRAVSRAELALLSDICAGRTLGEAVERLPARVSGVGPDVVARWTSEWAAGGFFAEVRLPDRRV